MSSDPTVDPDMARSIEHAKHELESMIDLNPQIMLLISRDGTIRRANRALQELVGVDDIRDVLGQELSSVFRCPEPDFFTDLIEQT